MYAIVCYYYYASWYKLYSPNARAVLQIQYTVDFCNEAWTITCLIECLVFCFACFNAL